ncbi:hypothetical protein [Streptosporangium carneum]|uniref:Uncharacterized protein n=1 Tax=Streptosporangium carneum TaxID=47481 RepID=A0A9W6HVY8_9ACTN|nr:hypothetical protein [Streptosporangium carneum]GLK06786.1 hypothetical protein GCM10017600_01910 [Streptosporangium carneum]
MTPSRKPSRATVITASIAIGVFGAGAGLGTVIAARSEQPVKGEVIRLAAGTYTLNDGAQAWTSQKAGGDPAPPAGSNAGGAITDKGAAKTSMNAKICLTATIDGHAVSGGGGGCQNLPVLASAHAPLQRPGNPKSVTTKEAAPPKTATNPPAVKPVKNSTPQENGGGGGGGGGNGGGGGGGGTQKAPDPAPIQPPKATTKPAPAPAPTKKVSGNISDSGSTIDKPSQNLAEKPKLNIGASAGPKSADDREEKKQQEPPAPKQAKPTGTLKPALPNSTQKPKSQGTSKPTSPTAAPKPSGPLKPAHPTSEPLVTNGPAEPDRPAQEAQLPTPDSQQEPDGSVLRPADPSQEGGASDGSDSLPVFKDPELLRRAQEALGLDKNMRYTDENGVWDLNIAPPGTPPCRDYSPEELQGLGADQEGAVIPRDSCQWPAFVRWLYAEPAPGEVSNWTKFTGLPERNLEFVVTNQAPEQPDQQNQQGEQGQSDQQEPGNEPGQLLPDQPGQLDPAQPDQQNQQNQQNQSDPAQPSGPEQHSSRFDRSGGVDPAQPPQHDRRGSGHVKSGPGQVEPYQDGYTGP